MPKTERSRGNNGEGARKRVSAEEKIARLLALLLLKDVKKDAAKVPVLRSVGFEVSEIAAMLGMTENNVRVAAHRGRKKKGG